MTGMEITILAVALMVFILLICALAVLDNHWSKRE